VPFARVAVLGLGLLGGSVALAARARGAAQTVSGATRRPDVLDEARRIGAVDEAGSYEDAVRGADLVVLATPLFAMEEVVRHIAPHLSDGAVLTDVGSVKGSLADTLPGLLPPGPSYVGSHPMAGSHRRGLDHAREDLFEGAPCIVTGAAGDPSCERVCEFWTKLGAKVVLRAPAAHDEQVAWMSHVPHALAFAFASALARAPEAAFEVAGSGFRDFSRIARSDPELWADILNANRKALAAPLQAAAEALGKLTRAIEADDVDALVRQLTAARAALARGGVRGPDSAD
jgi:prephenate dehydrogenase